LALLIRAGLMLRSLSHVHPGFGDMPPTAAAIAIVSAKGLEKGTRAAENSKMCE